jgi:hypothetical protein
MLLVILTLVHWYQLVPVMRDQANFGCCWVAVSEMWSRSGIWLAVCDCVVYYSLIYWLDGRGIVAGYFGSGEPWYTGTSRYQ